MPYSKRLDRQLKKYLGSSEIESTFESLSQIEAITDAAAKKALKGFGKLLDDIDKTYAQTDEKLDRAIRNLEVSSAELTVANQNINSMLNSLGQGFLSFGPDGLCCPTYSKACEAMFGTIPAGKYVWDIVGLDEAEKEDFKSWIRLAFEDRIDFADIQDFAPQDWITEKNQILEFDYKLIRRPDETVERIVLIATDKTQEKQAKNLAEERSRYADRVVKLLSNKVHFSKFVAYFRQFVSDNIGMTDLPSGTKKETFLRQVHTLKGSAGAFMLDDLQAKVHKFEEWLLSGCDQLSASKVVEEIRDWEKTIDAFLEECKNIFEDDLEGSHLRVQLGKRDLDRFYHSLREAGYSELANLFYSQFLTEQASQSVAHLDSIVRELSHRLNKPMKPLVITGGDIKIDPRPYERLLSNLVHVVRNSIDHGIEDKEVRILQGKDSEGTLAIDFAVSGSDLLITLKDDGRGIDPKAIRKKCEALGIELNPNATTQEIIQMVFHDGFSTASKATDISGRGVGMSSLLEEARALGGTVWVESEFGVSCRTIIRVPYGCLKSFENQIEQIAS